MPRKPKVAPRDPEITTIIATRETSWGGLTAILVGDTLGEEFQFAPVFLRANHWRGTEQPRLVLTYSSDGYNDWRRLLDASPRIRRQYQYVGSPSSARNREDQWLTFAPSPLLPGPQGPAKMIVTDL